MAVLEQGINTFEQKSLSTTLEIAGIPDIPQGDLKDVLSRVVVKLELDENDIQSTQRLPSSKDKPCVIRMEMKTKSVCKHWIEASKKKRLTVGQVIPDVVKDKAENRIYIREALTKHVKSILYNSKIQLSKSFQFIWCKDGNVCARKNSNSKIYSLITGHQSTISGLIKLRIYLPTHSF